VAHKSPVRHEPHSGLRATDSEHASAIEAGLPTQAVRSAGFFCSSGLGWQGVQDGDGKAPLSPSVSRRNCREDGQQAVLFFPENFSKDHKCATKGVFLLAMELNDDSIPTEEDIAMSLAAITGINTEDTLRLNVVINGMTLQALVDTGSTHTFIHDELAQNLGLHITRRPGLSVKVANGERVMSPGVCHATPVRLEPRWFRSGPGSQVAQNLGSSQF